MADWSLTSIQSRLIKIGARVVRHARKITFQLACSQWRALWTDHHRHPPSSHPRGLHDGHNQETQTKAAPHLRPGAAQIAQNLRQARNLVAAWRIDFNQNRPHSSLAGLRQNTDAARKTANCQITSEPLHLNEHLFENLRQARNLVAAWRIDFNQNRPHSSLAGLTPSEYANRSKEDQNLNRANLN